MESDLDQFAIHAAKMKHGRPRNNDTPHEPHDLSKTLERSFQEMSIMTPVLQHCLVGIVVAGLLLNTIQIVSVSKLLKRKQIAKVAGRFLRMQAVFDGLVCLVIIPVSFNDASMPLPQTTFPQLTTALAYIVCHVWYSQYLFWQCQLYSVFNLMLLSIDRCVMIKFGMKHQRFIRRQKPITICLFSVGFVFAAISSLYCTVEPSSDSEAEFAAFNFSAHNASLQETFQCKMGSQMFNDSFTHWYSLTWFMLGYAVPALIMVVCYSLMISTLLSERNTFEESTSNSIRSKTMAARQIKIKNATRQLIKTVILMGISFIVCLFLDSVTTLLNAFGLHDYVFNTPVQKLGMMLIAVNCAVGPGVTFLLVPLLRKTAIMIVRKALCCRCRCRDSRKEQAYSVATTAT